MKETLWRVTSLGSVWLSHHSASPQYITLRRSHNTDATSLPIKITIRMPSFLHAPIFVCSKYYKLNLPLYKCVACVQRPICATSSSCKDKSQYVIHINLIFCFRSTINPLDLLMGWIERWRRKTMVKKNVKEKGWCRIFHTKKIRYWA